MRKEIYDIEYSEKSALDKFKTIPNDVKYYRLHCDKNNVDYFVNRDGDAVELKSAASAVTVDNEKWAVNPRYQETEKQSESTLPPIAPIAPIIDTASEDLATENAKLKKQIQELTDQEKQKCMELKEKVDKLTAENEILHKWKALIKETVNTEGLK